MTVILIFPQVRNRPPFGNIHASGGGAEAVRGEAVRGEAVRGDPEDRPFDVDPDEAWLPSDDEDTDDNLVRPHIITAYTVYLLFAAVFRETRSRRTVQRIREVRRVRDVQSFVMCGV